MYGATNQQPMSFQTITTKMRRSIVLERGLIKFHVFKDCDIAIKEQLTVPTGYVQISSKEQTMLDLVRLYKECGYLSNEHFSVLGLSQHPFESLSSWGTGKVEITTFPIEELLGTKMRALYQRRKGRDLYDLYIALTTLKVLDTSKLLHCFREYMKFGGHGISKKLFVDNMELKMQHPGFCGDMSPLLPTGTKMFDPHVAYEYVLEELIQHI